MKKSMCILCLIALAFALLSSANSGAALCTQEEQTILLLSDVANAHAAHPNSGSNYSAAVCYDSLFGVPYSENSPNVCNGNNSVLNLTSTTNAHAGTIDAPGHGTGICYGDLSCRITLGSCNAALGERRIAVLSSVHNAHLSLNVTDDYPYSICCSRTAPPQAKIQEVYWADRGGNIIAANIVSIYVNDTVLLVARTGLSRGTEVEFYINEQDAINDDVIIGGSNPLKAGVGDFGAAQIEWFISDADMENAAKNGIGNEYEDGLAEFYFTAKASGDEKKSGLLLVNNTQAPFRPPRAIICAPEHRQIYFVGEGITFNDCSTGSVSERKWSITEDNIDFTMKNFVHTFNTSGQKTITLRVGEGLTASEAQIAILLINSGGLFSFINKPYHHQIVSVLPNNYAVSFSAEESYLINVSLNQNCGGEIICLGGLCPDQTVNPSPYGSQCGSPLDVSNPNQNFNNLNFIWKFSDGTSLAGKGKARGTKSYSRASNSLYDELIELELSYENTSAGLSLNKQSRRSFTIGQCLLREGNEGVSIVLGSDGFIREIKSINEGGCVGADGIADSADDCCRAYEVCVPGTQTRKAHCEVKQDLVENFTGCSSYAGRAVCIEDKYQAAQKIDLLRKSEPVCGKPYENYTNVICRCAWNGTSEVATEAGEGCYLRKTLVGPEDDCVDFGACLVKSNTIQTCDEQAGYFLLREEAHYIPPTQPSCREYDLFKSECVPREVPVPCVQRLQLPFTSALQLFLAGILIALAYFSYLRKIA